MCMWLTRGWWWRASDKVRGRKGRVRMFVKKRVMVLSEGWPGGESKERVCGCLFSITAEDGDAGVA